MKRTLWARGRRRCTESKDWKDSSRQVFNLRKMRSAGWNAQRCLTCKGMWSRCAGLDAGGLTASSITQCWFCCSKSMSSNEPEVVTQWPILSMATSPLNGGAQLCDLPQRHRVQGVEKLGKALREYCSKMLSVPGGPGNRTWIPKYKASPESVSPKCGGGQETRRESHCLCKSSWDQGHPSPEVCWFLAAILSFTFLSVFMSLFIRQIIHKCLLTWKDSSVREVDKANYESPSTPHLPHFPAQGLPLSVVGSASPS